MIDKTETSGFIVLFVGVALLVFTFFNAYLFLKGLLNIISSADLMESFGQALAPLIEACIRAIYLGIMGWIGSILTVRGVNILTQIRHEAQTQAKVSEQYILEPSKGKQKGRRSE
jgi:hypothetical protein